MMPSKEPWIWPIRQHQRRLISFNSDHKIGGQHSDNARKPMRKPQFIRSAAHCTETDDSELTASLRALEFRLLVTLQFYYSASSGQDFTSLM